MYKEIEPKIENTIFEERVVDDKVLSYRVRPIDGYKLHEITLDSPLFENGIEVEGKIKLGYTKSYITIGANYNFSQNNRQIYTKPDSEEDEIVDISNSETNAIDSEIIEKAKAYDILMGVEE